MILSFMNVKTRIDKYKTHKNVLNLGVIYYISFDFYKSK